MEPSSASSVVEWFKARLNFAYEEEHWDQTHIDAIISFCRDPAVSVLYAHVEEGIVVVDQNSTSAITKMNKAVSVFCKRSQVSSEPLDSAEALSRGIFATTVRTDAQMDAFEQVLLQLSGVYAPAAVGAKNWPENISKEFANGSRKFLASAVELYYQAKGSTVLYVPPLPAAAESSGAGQGLDKETVQRLEAMVIHWTRQVKEVIMDSSSSTSSIAETGPLGELAFWRGRCVDFSRLHSQLQSSDVRRILGILEKNQSAYLPPFKVIEKDIEQGSVEAMNNMQYLSVLEEPCLALTKVTEPGQIPELLLSILSAVRLIWSTSLYYNTSERITTLLRKVSAEIIVRCSQCISLKKVFAGADVHRSIALLRQALEVGRRWRSLYQKTALLIKEKHKPMRWDETAEGTIFAQVDAFVQRCVDLLELCEGQIQFAPLRSRVIETLPPFGGSKGGDVFKALVEIENTFIQNVEKLKKAGEGVYSPLDVRASRWREDYAVFKASMKDLEIVYMNVINLAIDSTGGTIAATVQVVDSFWTLARREWIVNYVRKKASEIYAQFIETTNQIKKEFELYRSDAKLLSATLLTGVQGLPPHAGTAAWAKGLHLRLSREWKALEHLSHMLVVAVSAAQQQQQAKDLALVTETFHNLNSQLESFILTAFHAWVEELKSLDESNLGKRLEKPLLIRALVGVGGADEDEEGEGAGASSLFHRTKDGQLESNFDRGLSKVLREAYYWEKLQGAGIVVPYAAHEIAEQSEAISKIKEHVLSAVREYNVILSMLSPEERRLFSQHLSQLDARIKPALAPEEGEADAAETKLNWKSENIQKDFVDEALTKCAEVLAKVVQFKKNQSRILQLCKGTAESLMIRIERKVVYRVDEFKQLQADTRTRVQGVFRQNHEEIGEILQDSYQLFLNQSADVQREWRSYVHKTDKRVEDALKRSMKSSLQELARALRASASSSEAADGTGDSGEVYPLFKMQAVLEGIRMDFRPSINQVKDLLQSVCRDMTLVLTNFERLDAGKLTPECLQASGISGPAQKGVTLGLETSSAETSGSYFEEISKDEESVIRHVKEVLKLFNGCSLKLNEKIKWWSGSYQPIVSLDKEGFVKRYARMERSLATVGQDIQRYRDVQSEIQQEEFKGVVAFVEIDYTLLKQALVQHCQQWVQKLTGLLHDQCRNEMNTIYEYFRHNTSLLSEPPTTFPQLEEKIALFASCQAKLEEYMARVQPIRDKYAKLGEFDVSPSDENEQNRLDNLEREFEVFRQTLIRADGLLAKTKKQMRGQLESDMSAFAQELRDLNLQFRETAPFAETSSTEVVDYGKRQAMLDEYETKVGEKREVETSFVPKITLFQMEQQTNMDLEAVDTEVKLLKRVWKLAEEWSGVWSREFEAVSFVEADSEVLRLIDADYSEKLQAIAMAGGNVVWTWGVFKKLSTEINTFSATLPLIKIFKSKAIRPRHWDALLHKVAATGASSAAVSADSPSFTLARLFALELTKHVEFVDELGRRATSEERVEKELRAIEQKWEKEVVLDLVEFFARPGVGGRLKLRPTQEAVMAVVEEHSVALAAMKHSRASAPFVEKIKGWEEKLGRVEETVRQLLTLQKLWTGLDAVAGTSEAGDALDLDSIETFKEVDAYYAGVVQEIRTLNALAVKVASQTSTERLGHYIEKLERLVKDLERYLERKRQQCPRLYLLSDEELVECLSKDVESGGVVQRCVKRLFAGLDGTLEISQKNSTVYEVQSVGDLLGERVKLFKAVTWDLSQGVDVWMNSLDKRLKETLRRLFSVCHNANVTPKGMKKDKWVKEHVGQLLTMSSAVHANAEIAAVLGSSAGSSKLVALRTLKKQWLKQIAKLAEVGSKNSLTALDRAKLSNVILAEIQGKDNIDALVSSKSDSLTSFVYQALLKHSVLSTDAPQTLADPDYLPNIGTVAVSQLGMTLLHGHEFASAAVSGLVITPLTERVHLALGCAMQLAMGGLVRGVSESGKTETVKEFGRLLGRATAIINCDELSATASYRLLAMAVQGGVFVCLDEANKLRTGILSVFGLMIRTVQNAVRERTDSLVLEGNQLRLNYLNAPAASGAGVALGLFGTTGPFTAHPRYFQDLWRPISVAKPDTALIIEGLLTAYGSADAKTLSRKLLTMFDLLPQQLSGASHYAWGLRTVKAVTKAVGEAIVALGAAAEAGSETAAAVRALLESVSPRLTSEDLQNFRALLALDVFPGVDFQTTASEDKLEELVATHGSRRGLAVVGPSLSGKSELIARLAAKVGASVHVVYPAALSEGSAEVVDIIEAIIKAASAEKPVFVVFDGPTNVAWTEQLNTLLDETAAIQRESGERLVLGGHVRLILETCSMENLTPSTVSRVGVVYLEKTLPWNTVFARLLTSTGIPSNLQADLVTLSDKWLPRLLAETPGVSGDCALVRALVPMLKTLLADCPAAPVERVFALACVLAIGRRAKSRSNFDSLVREIDNNVFPAGNNTVFDWTLSGDSANFVAWPDFRKLHVPATGEVAGGNSVVVGTPDLAVNVWLSRLLVRAGETVVIRGAAGSGKRTVLRVNLESNVGGSLLLVMHRPTRGTELQDALFARVVRRIKNRYGPSGASGRVLQVAVDDLALPNTAGVTEAVRQALEHGSWWRALGSGGERRLVSTELEDVKFIGTCSSSTATNLQQSSGEERRLWSRVAYVETQTPETTTLARIFGAHAERVLRNFREDMRLMGEALASATVALVQSLQKSQTASASWTLQDGVKLFRGLDAAQGERCFDERMLLVGLWAHEAARVFGDRLTSETDRGKFDKLVEEVLEQHMQTKLKDVRHVYDGLVGRLEARGEYRVIADVSKAKTVVETRLQELNEALRETGGNIITVVLFADAIRQIFKVTRALAISGGHMVAVGGKGSGRKGVGRLAAHMSRKKCMTAESVEELKEAVENLAESRAGEGVCAIVDARSSQTLLAHAATLMAAGNVRPDLFGREAWSRVQGKTLGRANLEEQLRTDFHVVLTVESGEDFRRLRRDYPGIFRTSEIVHFPIWPTSALAEVARSRLGASEGADKAVCEAMGDLQQTVLSRGGGGSLFYECAGVYARVRREKRADLEQRLAVLMRAIGKVEEARGVVDALVVGQEKEREELTRREKECEELNLVAVEKQMAYDEQAKTVDAEMIKIGKEEQDLKVLTEDAQRELLKAMPALEAAVDALEKLDKKAIAEVKAYAKPPELVMKTMTAVMTVLDKAPTWAQAKLELNDVNFLPKLKTFDKDNISNSTLKKITNFTKDPTFQPSVVGKVSTAAGALCQWVHAMKLYADVYREVQPKRLKLQNAEETLEKKHQLVRDMQEKLAHTKTILQETQKAFDGASEKKNQLQVSVEEIRLKLEKAEQLVGSLAADLAKWEARVEMLQSRVKAVAGDALLAVFLMVFGTTAASVANNQSQIETWRKILKKHKIEFSEDFDAVKFLMNTGERRRLPSKDAFNALAICAVLKFRGERYVPLIVDEYGIFRKLVSLDFRVVDVTEEQPFKAAVSQSAGSDVLFDDLSVETLEALASQHLRISAHNPRDYRVLFSVRELGHLSAGETCFFPVHFRVTPTALADELVRLLVAREEPRMQEQAAQASAKLFETQRRLEGVETLLLETVAGHADSLLEDAGGKLAGAIASCRASVEQALEQIDANEQTLTRIESAKEAYQHAGERCAAFFEATKVLKRVNTLYRPLSYDRFLDIFATLYERSSEKLDSMTSNVEDKVALFSQNFVVAAGKLVLRSLLDKHKVVFLVSLARQFAQEHAISSFDSVADALLCNVRTLRDLELADEAAFKGVEASASEQHSAEWRRFETSETPEKEPLPADWDTKLHALQKLAIVKVLRPDRLLPGLHAFLQQSASCVPELFKPLTTSELVLETSSEELLLAGAGAWPVTVVIGQEPETSARAGRLVVSAESAGERVVETLETAMKTGQTLTVLQAERKPQVWLAMHKRLLGGAWKSGFRLVIVAAEPQMLDTAYPVDLVLRSAVVAVDRKSFGISGSKTKPTGLAGLAAALAERQRQSGEDLGGYVQSSDLEVAALAGTTDGAKFMASEVAFGAKVWEPEKRELVNAIVEDVLSGNFDEAISGSGVAGLAARGVALGAALSLAFEGRRIFGERRRETYGGKLASLAGAVGNLATVEVANAALEEGPVRSAMTKEAERLNGWVQWCRSEICRLQRVFELGNFEEKDELTMDVLTQNAIPASWPSPYLRRKFSRGSWTSELKERLDGVRKLLEISGGQSVRAVNFRVLSSPQNFLAAVLLQSARRQNVAVDSLVFDAQPLATNSAEEALAHAPPKDGVYVEGLHLVASEWDMETGSLVPAGAVSASVAVSAMPVLWFRPVKRSPATAAATSGNAGDSAAFSCPIFVTSDKRGRRGQASLVAHVDLKSKQQSANFWIKRGTCLLVHPELHL